MKFEGIINKWKWSGNSSIKLNWTFVHKVLDFMSFARIYIRVIRPPQSIVSSWVCKTQFDKQPKLNKSNGPFFIAKAIAGLHFYSINIFRRVFGHQTQRLSTIYGRIIMIWNVNTDKAADISCKSIAFFQSLAGLVIFGGQPSEGKTIKFYWEFMMICAHQGTMWTTLHKRLTLTVDFQCYGYSLVECGHVRMLSLSTTLNKATARNSPTNSMNINKKEQCNKEKSHDQIITTLNCNKIG